LHPPSWLAGACFRLPPSIRSFSVILLSHIGSHGQCWHWSDASTCRYSGARKNTKEAIGIFYGDSAGGDSAFRYYAGVIWVEPLKADGGIELLEVPGGKYASHRLVGSYHGIPSAFQRLYGEWLPKSGFVPDDRPALEIYRNNPYDTPANDLITDLLIPLR
jgi:DNA gyrase inhibitor GyrI